MVVGIRDLKTNLSRYLGRVRGGTTIEVTSHGRTIATIQPAGAGPRGLDWVRTMVTEGRARWSGGKPVGLTPSPRLRGRGKTLAEMLIEDRE